MQEFTRVRAAIDTLIEGTKESIKRKSISESMEQLDQARGLIQELKQLSTEHQAAIVAKRETTVAGLTDIAGRIKTPVVRKKTVKETVVQAAIL